MEKFNPSAAIRGAIYVFAVFANAFVGSLVASGAQVSVWIVAALAGYNAVVALMARANITPDK